MSNPRIADAAVIGVPEDEAGEVPMAFLLAAGDARMSLDDLGQDPSQGPAGHPAIGA